MEIIDIVTYSIYTLNMIYGIFILNSILFTLNAYLLAHAFFFDACTRYKSEVYA